MNKYPDIQWTNILFNVGRIALIVYDCVVVGAA